MDIDEKDKENLFLKDKVYQLESQLSILQKRVRKHQKKPRYTLRERLFILWHIETFGIARRKVTEHLGVSRSTLYRWLHQIDDTSHTRIPANKTPLEIAILIWEITRVPWTCMILLRRESIYSQRRKLLDSTLESISTRKW